MCPGQTINGERNYNKLALRLGTEPRGPQQRGGTRGRVPMSHVEFKN